MCVFMMGSTKEMYHIARYILRSN